MSREAVSNGRKVQDTQDLDDRIAQLVSQIRAAQQSMDRTQARIEDIKNELRILLELRGENWSDDLGYARLTSEGVRTLYDTRALDELIIKDPLHYGWLKDYRSEASIRSTVQVK
jgi:hypothetical protein